MKVLGIDPGYDRVGIAIAESVERKDVILFSMCIETNSKDAFVERLFVIGKELERVINQHKPTHACLETLFFQTNTKTAMKVSEARGMMQYILRKHNLTIYDIGPGQVKSSITGNGRATKQEVIKMTQLITQLPDMDKKKDDEVDAMAIALAGLHMASSILPQG